MRMSQLTVWFISLLSVQVFQHALFKFSHEYTLICMKSVEGQGHFLTMGHMSDASRTLIGRYDLCYLYTDDKEVIQVIAVIDDSVFVWRLGKLFLC